MVTGRKTFTKAFKHHRNYTKDEMCLLKKCYKIKIYKKSKKITFLKLVIESTEKNIKITLEKRQVYHFYW